jgi:hypothetical protein
MPLNTTRRNTNKYTKWIGAPDGVKIAPINRSGWNQPKIPKGWFMGGKSRKNRKTRKYR